MVVVAGRFLGAAEMARTELMPGRAALALRTALKLAVGLSLGVLGLSAAGAAEAAPQRLAWSTFLRAGPGDQFAALDEIEHSTSVEVLGCAAGWCRIQEGRTVGYIDQDALTLPKVPGGATPPASAPNCFVAGQVSYPEAAPTRFCETAPKTH
jgi:hypothetical protein